MSSKTCSGLLFIVNTMACIGLTADAAAQVVVTTNQNGADAEVRKSDINPDPASGMPLGNNRGDSTELATRLIDRTEGGGSDRSSAIYLKFDISGITQQDLDSNVAQLRLHVRNNNINPGRAEANAPSFDDENDPGPLVQMQFDVFGLTNFALGDWQEDEITYYNAPGISVPDPSVPAQDPGKYDFNDDLLHLGTFQLPTVPPQNWLAVGSSVDFADPDGLLHDLVQDAKDAGQTHLSLVVAHGLDGFLATDEEEMDGIIGTTPGTFLNFNYLFVPKEMTELNDDSGYDFDVDDPDNPLGGPWSMADNSGGAFSPKLMLVPEPSSVVLFGLGALAALAVARRRFVATR